MPYTKEELKNVDFYTDFVDDLRNKYLTELSSSSQIYFRDDNNVLLSYEDIVTNDGIENADINNSLYKILYSKSYNFISLISKQLVFKNWLLSFHLNWT